MTDNNYTQDCECCQVKLEAESRFSWKRNRGSIICLPLKPVQSPLCFRLRVRRETAA